MVLSTETFNQSVRTEYSEAVNARYTFQPLWVSVHIHVYILPISRQNDQSRKITNPAELGKNKEGFLSE